MLFWVAWARGLQAGDCKGSSGSSSSRPDSSFALSWLSWLGGAPWVLTRHGVDTPPTSAAPCACQGPGVRLGAHPQPGALPTWLPRAPSKAPTQERGPRPLPPAGLPWSCSAPTPTPTVYKLSSIYSSFNLTILIPGAPPPLQPTLAAEAVQNASIHSAGGL